MNVVVVRCLFLVLFVLFCLFVFGLVIAWLALEAVHDAGMEEIFDHFAFLLHYGHSPRMTHLNLFVVVCVFVSRLLFFVFVFVCFLFAVFVALHAFSPSDSFTLLDEQQCPF